MKYLIIAFVLSSLIVNAQLTSQVANDSAVTKYHIGQYSYHAEFINHKSYGAPLIFTANGGGAVFGDGDEGSMLVRLDKTGKTLWKKTISPKGEEMESQSVVEDKLGNFYVFILVHGLSEHRGGCERVVMLNKVGTIVWDKFIGTCQQLNNPTVDYIKALPDGRISMRGHVVKTKPPEGQDPTYVLWEGWLDKTGKLTQKTGQVIDWKKQEEWKALFKPQ
ncbi:MAG TPA: hypothetical protein VGK39_09135 [Cyclobacteriaceae bacterium]